jgi:hypothetical protein
MSTDRRVASEEVTTEPVGARGRIELEALAKMNG